MTNSFGIFSLLVDRALEVTQPQAQRLALKQVLEHAAQAYQNGDGGAFLAYLHNESQNPSSSVRRRRLFGLICATLIDGAQSPSRHSGRLWTVALPFTVSFWPLDALTPQLACPQMAAHTQLQVAALVRRHLIVAPDAHVELVPAILSRESVLAHGAVPLLHSLLGNTGPALRTSLSHAPELTTYRARTLVICLGVWGPDSLEGAPVSALLSVAARTQLQAWMTNFLAASGLSVTQVQAHAPCPLETLYFDCAGASRAELLSNLEHARHVVGPCQQVQIRQYGESGYLEVAARDPATRDTYMLLPSFSPLETLPEVSDMLQEVCGQVQFDFKGVALQRSMATVTYLH